MRAKFPYCLILLAAFFLPAASAAPTPGSDTLPASLDGSMMPYDFSACDPLPSYPDSLRPVGITYVARHGARYLSGEKKLKGILTALQNAYAAGNLSDTGVRFLDYVESVKAHNEGNWGALSPEGIREERLLADRAHAILPQLSDSATAVSAKASFVPRAVMTMYEFTHGLIDRCDNIEVSTSEGRQFSPLLYCFAYDREYAAFRSDGTWKGIYDEFVKEYVPEAPARALFRDHKGFSAKRLREITLEMYEVMKGNRASGLPAPKTWMMSAADYRACWRASNLQHYLRNCISPISDLAGKATRPLLDSIISDIDRIFSLRGDNSANGEKGKNPSFYGYFGHAETLLPLLSLMRLPGCYTMPGNYATLQDSWKIEEVTPLGANLLILLLESPSGTPMVMMQLNGRNITPLPGHGLIVGWEELREFWRQ